jgi:putative PIN family toxin of toxin-antitoxin system
LDTNILISSILKKSSIPGQCVSYAFRNGKVLTSAQTMEELASVLVYPKFDRYVSMDERKKFIRYISRTSFRIPIIYPVHACRDPKDDKFLELAVNGEADMIVSGDDDLLMLNPFRGIKILSPLSFLETVAQSR